MESDRLVAVRRWLDNYKGDIVDECNGMISETVCRLCMDGGADEACGGGDELDVLLNVALLEHLLETAREDMNKFCK